MEDLEKKRFMAEDLEKLQCSVVRMVNEAKTLKVQQQLQKPSNAIH